jgi:hypothetical protein
LELPINPNAVRLVPMRKERRSRPELMGVVTQKKMATSRKPLPSQRFAERTAFRYGEEVIQFF